MNIFDSLVRKYSALAGYNSSTETLIIIIESEHLPYCDCALRIVESHNNESLSTLLLVARSGGDLNLATFRFLSVPSLILAP